MNTSLAALTNFAWLSQAAYLDLQGLLVEDSLLAQRLQVIGYAKDKVFAENQATQITSATTGFSFVSQSPGTNGNDDYGFSATVFKSNADNAYTIAVRGTEPSFQYPVDLWQADVLGVVLAGKATEQLISAYRYYKEIVSSTAVTAPGIYSEAEITMLSQLYARTWSAILSGPALEVKMALFVESLRHDLGLALIPAGAPINFTGHSLGGHVATLLAAMVANNDTTHAVGQVFTYNAPGQDAIPNEILNWLGINTGTNGGVLQDKIINVIGEGGLNVTAGLGSLAGPKQMIFIESEGWSTGNLILINNHSVVKQSDSLAVYALFAKLDPSLNSNGLDTIKSLLKASTNIVANSLSTKGVRVINLLSHRA